MGDRGRWRALSFLVLAAASWGTGTVLSKAAVAELPPLTLLGAQLLVSVLVLALLVIRDRPSLRRVDRRLLALGALNPGLAYALSLIGLTTISASLSVLIWAIEPILILLLAGAVLGERPGWLVAALSGLALAGLAAVLAGPSASVGGGVAATIAGVACCALYSVGSRRWIAEAPSTLGIVFGQQVIAAMVVLAAIGVATAAGQPWLPTPPSPPALAAVVSSGVLYYGAAYLFYLTALRELRASVAAISFYLVPLFGVAVAAAAGETLTLVQWLGGAATIVAVVWVGVLEIRRSATASLTRGRPPAAGRPRAARSR